MRAWQVKFGTMAWLLALLLVAKADTTVSAGKKPGPSLEVQAEYVEMSHEALTELLFLYNPTEVDATELRSKVQDLVKAGRAKVLETQFVHTRDGAKSLAEAGPQRAWPRDFPPPTFTVVHPPGKPGSFSPNHLTALAALVTPPTPTGFDRWQQGSQLEVEPVKIPGKEVVILDLTGTLTWQLKDTAWTEWVDPFGSRSTHLTPKFYTLRFQARLGLKSGQYGVAAALSPKDSRGDPDLNRKVLVFVKATLLRAK